MNILILDDDADRHAQFKSKLAGKNGGHDLYLAYSVADTHRIIGTWTVKIDLMLLDHDLGIGEPDGYDFVKSLRDLEHKPRAAIIHSMNPSGAANMLKYLELIGIKGFYYPGLFGRPIEMVNGLVNDVNEVSS